MCGKLAHLKSFSPEDYDEDITHVEMQSLGRGKGFAVTGEYSVQEDEALTGRIAKRARASIVWICPL